MKKTQKDRVIGRILAKGRITRNECLQNRITRLAAIIDILKKEGWEFSTEEVRGDYVYKLVKAPTVY